MSAERWQVSYWRKFVSRNLLKSCGCRVMMSASRSISRQWYWSSRLTYGSLLSSSKYALVRTYKKRDRFSGLWPTVMYKPSKCKQIMDNLQKCTILVLDYLKYVISRSSPTTNCNCLLLDAAGGYIVFDRMYIVVMKYQVSSWHHNPEKHKILISTHCDQC